MGVREFNAWVNVTVDRNRQSASPDRWDRNDTWFEEERRKFRSGV